MTTRSFDFPANRIWLGLAGLVALPFVEFAAFFWVADRVGLSLALLLLVATSFLGASLLRRQGALAFTRMVRAFGQGEAPGGAARESIMTAVGGLLMILPGFVTDLIGFALMMPGLLRHLRERGAVDSPRRPADAGRDRRVIDLNRDEWTPVDEQ